MAADLTAFNERFDFVRNDDGSLRLIRDNTITTKLTIKPYLKMLKDRLLDEQMLMSNKSAYEHDIRSLFADDKSFDTQEIFENNVDKGLFSRRRRARNEKMVLDSLRSIGDVNIESVFSNSEFKELLTNFEKKLTESLEILDLRIVAHATDSSFFYKKAVGYKVVDWALNQARKKFSSVPVLNTISYIIVQTHDLVSENRMFRQNMLLHYIENATEEELGLSHDEANRVLSSIYESRIEWFNYYESKRAQGNWEKYGVNTFYSLIRTSNSRWRGRRDLGEMGARINFAFQESEQEDGKVIYNLFHTDHQYSKKPALAYDFSRPKFVMRKRMVVKLAELGVSFLTLPSWIKTRADDFLKSIYKEQELSEGALYAYFESQGDENGMMMVKRQFFNPFANL
jgi:hypothetical protein